MNHAPPAPATAARPDDASVALPATLRAWGTQDFAATLRRELDALPADALPLRQALRQGSHVVAGSVSARLLSAQARPDGLRVKVGLFFSSIVAGCSCADDPTPIEPLAEYCECLLDIDGASARVTVTQLDD